MNKPLLFCLIESLSHVPFSSLVFKDRVVEKELKINQPRAHNVSPICREVYGGISNGCWKENMAWILSPQGFYMPELNLEDKLRPFWASSFKRDMPQKAHDPILKEIAKGESEMTQMATRRKDVHAKSHSKQKKGATVLLRDTQNYRNNSQ